MVKKQTRTKSRTLKKAQKSGFRFKWWMGVVLVVVVAGIGLAILRFSQASTTTNVVKTYGVQDLGLMTSNDKNIVGRDSGQSGVVGDKPFWLFGDTLYNTNNIGRPVEPWEFRSMTGAYGEYSSPTSLTDTLGPDGLLPQTVPFSASELAYNKQKNKFDDRYALWPSGMVPVNSNSSYIFFSSILIGKGDLNYKLQYFGVAKLEKGQYVAKRLTGDKGLFTGQNIPLSVEFQEGNMIYYSSCQVGAFLSSPCKIGRVDIGSILNQNAYMWWDGKNWQRDYSKATQVLDGSTTGMSIKYNPYLKKYVAVYLPIFNNSLRIRTADSITGPWSEAQELYKTLDSTKGNNYAANMHPEYDPSGKLLYVSYLDTEKGNIRLLQFAVAPVDSVEVALPNSGGEFALTQPNSSGGCKIQQGFKNNSNFRACVIEPSNSLSVSSARFLSVGGNQIKICVTALNPTQKPLRAELGNNQIYTESVQLDFGSEGIGKILACGKVKKPGQFNSLRISTSEKVLASKIVVSAE